MSRDPRGTTPPAMQMPRRPRASTPGAACRDFRTGCEPSQFVQDNRQADSVDSSSHMAPLIVMLVGWLVARSIGAVSVWPPADSWSGALRFALAAMFLFTAGSHFHPRTRPDLIRMVPPSL